MVKGGIGGGNTITGLIYEGKVDLPTYLAQQHGYTVIGSNVFYKKKLVARVFKKYGFYDFLQENGIQWEEFISCRLLPDNCIYVIVNNTLFIIEVKHQSTPGSVDEKLQTCDFKKKQYQKLLQDTPYDVEYLYVCNDWFRQNCYSDVHDYIHSVGCHIFFDAIPLGFLGL